MWNLSLPPFVWYLFLDVLSRYLFWVQKWSCHSRVYQYHCFSTYGVLHKTSNYSHDYCGLLMLSMVKIVPFKMEKGGLETRENSCTLSPLWGASCIGLISSMHDLMHKTWEHAHGILEAVLSPQITRQHVILVRMYVNCHWFIWAHLLFNPSIGPVHV
jgi:hypothetical protein